MRCSKCESAFVRNGVPPDIAKQLYGSAVSQERWTQKEPFRDEKTPDVVAFLSKFLQPGKKVLDIGCGAGGFLDFALAHGCETSGVEFSTSAVRFATDRGHRVVMALSELDRDFFDVVTAIDVIEHQYDPAKFLQGCVQVLKPGGVLIVFTGDINSSSARSAGVRWWYAGCPEHVAFPSMAFFRQRENLRLVENLHCYHGRWYLQRSPRNIIRTIGRLLKRTYDGMPPLGHDHIIVALRRVE
jgi:SAM-dependent methyltransferase